MVGVEVVEASELFWWLGEGDKQRKKGEGVRAKRIFLTAHSSRPLLAQSRQIFPDVLLDEAGEARRVTKRKSTRVMRARRRIFPSEQINAKKKKPGSSV